METKILLHVTLVHTRKPKFINIGTWLIPVVQQPLKDVSVPVMSSTHARRVYQTMTVHRLACPCTSLDLEEWILMPHLINLSVAESPAELPSMTQALQTSVSGSTLPSPARCREGFRVYRYHQASERSSCSVCLHSRLRET